MNQKLLDWIKGISVGLGVVIAVILLCASLVFGGKIVLVIFIAGLAIVSVIISIAAGVVENLEDKRSIAEIEAEENSV